MPQQIPESDWKIFRELRPLAVERFCERVLADVGLVAAHAGKSAHARYGEVYELMRRSEEGFKVIFDDLRRSTALIQLVAIRSRGLLTDAEFARFGAETRAAMQLLSGN